MAIAASLVRRTEMAVLFLAALAILLIAPGAISAETESEGATKEPAWSADMLVVEYTAVSIGAASADLFSNIGGSRDLKIKSLWSHVPSRDIRLAFQEGVSDVDDLTLIVGELALEFPPGSSGNSSFKWTDVDVDWEDGETIPVSIVQTSAPEEPEEKEEPAANNPATGAPTISGTAQVGETLTAETSSIADEDGLTNVSYSYQWTRSNGSTYADLAGETGSTYTLVYADQGKTVKVKVSFTDDADNDETLTSEATEVVTAAPNRAATGEPTISGTPNVDQTLTAATSAIADDDGLTKVSYSYQWIANDGNSDADIEDATDSTYTLSVSDVGKTIKVSVSFTDDRNNAEARTSVATAAVLATVPTEPLNLTVTRGSQIQELDASWQAPSSNGGSAVTGYKLQWKKAADSWDTEADVSEDTVTGTSHTITSLTGGVEYSVRVIATNIAGDGPGSTEVRATPAGSTTARRGLVVIMMSSRDHHSITKGTKTQFQVSASHLPRDNDPATVDYILRGDVTETEGGANVDSCEDANLGTDIPISVVDSVSVQYGGTFGGPGCTAGNYTVTYVVTEADTDNRMAGIVFYYEVTEGLSEGSLGSSNNPATGAPTISGTAQVGETLTAETSSIADTDGLDNVSFSYQWLSSRDTVIPGATGSTYTLVSTDLGKIIKVKVTFTDDEGNEESLTSAATAAVADGSNNPATGAPTISGTMQVGQTLTASTSGIADDDGLTNVSYTYQWIANDGTSDSDIQDATLSTYTLVSDDVDKTIKVKVSFTDDAENAETLTSSETDSVVAAPASNSPATGAPTITGTAQVGETLTASTTGISDTDGLTNVSYAYQWLTSRDAEIDGATSSTYTLVDADEGKTIQVRVTFTDDQDNAETLTSAATVEVAAAPVPLTASFLAAPSSHDGDNSFTFELRFSEEVEAGYARIRDDAFNVTGGDITQAQRKEQSSNQNWTITVEPDGNGQISITLPATTGCDDTGAICTGGGKKLSGRVELTVNGPEQQNQERQNTPAAGAPTISGTPQVGETLTADTSGISDAEELTNVSYRYQWLARGSDIQDATGSSYLLTASEQGRTIQVNVTFTDDSDNQESLTSAETLAVAARPNTAAAGEPTISGTPQVGETLTAGTSAIYDEDGLTNVSYQYQWLRDGTDIAGQTNSTYELVSADEGKTIRVRVSFTDDAGNDESLTSTATTAVAAQPAETPAVLLTASFANVPDDHNGENFTFQLIFSENVEAGYARIRDHAFTIDGATIDSASRITQGSNQGWNVEVDPTGNEAITITLPETTDCNAARAICTDDERKLSHATSEIVAGPPAISVSDANVQEAEGAVLEFSVTLSHASSRTVTVSYVTQDGTATAGPDYTATSATLTFNAGDLSQTVEVTVLTDSEDEGQETLTLTLSNPSQATLGDGTGTGTIENGESSSGTQEDPPAEDPPVVLLTASFGNMPATHNGSAFTFDLTFSENVRAGYERIRDDAFTISDGDIITSAVRKEQGSNQGWTITVQPDGNGAVYITLPETTDCNATGAICTYDERALSHSTPASIAGPQ